MAQVNSTVGDLEGNTRKVLEFISQGMALGVDLVLFPELAIPGYPPEDLLLKPQFVEDNLHCLNQIVEGSQGITVIVGFVDKKDDIYNAAAVIHNGALAGVYRKVYLPNYGVFDEDRYFQAGSEYPVFVIGGIAIGVNICEDIWYPDGPARLQALSGAEVILNLNSSPYHAGKWRFRQEMLATRAADNGVFIAYTNMVGGQDELVFDGHGMVFNPAGNIIARGRQFEEDLVVADLNVEEAFLARLHDPRRRKEGLAITDKARRIVVSDTIPAIEKPPLPEREIEPLEPLEEIYRALVLGTRDYVRKNEFKKAVIGLSGGIDSALTASIAVDALGQENVISVFMPSQYSSQESTEDAKRVAENLGIGLRVIPIQEAFRAYLDMLAPEFQGRPPDITEENLQARIRGNILMALSNKFGYLVLTTGNKSEMSVGYATLYGDMAGGFAVIKDVPKTLVYKLARHRNSRSGREVIPKRVLDKEPSAELKPDQRDVDTLPPYEVLDPILQAYVEEDKSFEEILAMGYEKGLVERVIAMVDRSEYKRRQAPPGVKITPRALGKDRRMPITNAYRSF